MKNENFVNVLASIITNYREQCHPKLSSREFADKCGVAKTVIHNIETKKHTGNLCNSTLDKIAKGLNLEDDLELRKLIENYNEVDISSNKPEDKSIILQPKTKLYTFFNLIKDFDEESIEMLHNLAVKFKK